MIKVNLSNTNGIVQTGALSQWDFGQVMEITGLSIENDTEIHFANHGEDEAIITMGKYAEGALIVEIPDISLTKGTDVFVFVYESSETTGRTIRKARIPIEKRAKPADYVDPKAKDYLMQLLEEAEKTIMESQKIVSEATLDRQKLEAALLCSTHKGEVITTSDSANVAPKKVRLYGKSTQDGTPSIETPIDIESHGDSGSIVGKVLSGNLLGSYDVRESYGICCKVDNGINHLYGTAKQDTTFVWVIGGYTQTQEELTLEAGTYSIEDNYQIHSYDGSVRNTYRGTFTINEKISVTGILYEATFVQGTTYDKYIEIMFNVGDSLKEFEPYTEQPFTVLTPNGLKGIGDVRDYVDFERRKFVQNIARHYITANDNIGKSGMSTDELSIFYLDMQIVKASEGGKASHIMSNIASQGIFQAFNVLNTVFTGGNGGDQPYFCVSSDVATTVEEFKTLCIEKGAYFDYVLKEPIETDLTEEEMAQYNALVMNYPNTTFINDANAHMEVEYVADTKEHIKQNYVAKSEHEALKERVSDIEQVIANL